MTEKEVEIRRLEERDQFEDAVELQKAIWGYADIELFPMRLFVVANKVGGHAYGAYAGARMVGFCLAIAGIKHGGGSYIHSHMLGVLPDYQNRGVGRRLKLAQREEIASRGIDLMEWTFDPLEIKNGYLNLHRLGVTVRRYVPNQYGSTTSHLHGGLPTDRCLAEWWIRSPRVAAIVSGKPWPHDVVERVSIPADVDQIKRRDPSRAREIQASVGERFQSAFDRGLALVAFERRESEGVYLLGPCE
jgi:predicted GNAT superfamily acetyltransferase